MSTLLECKDLTKCYGKKTAIDHINLAIESGHIIGLLGPNGSGKTTLIKMINGLLAPTSGLIFMQQNPIGAESKKHISYLPDHTYLNMNERVRDIIRYFSDFYEDFDEKRAYDMLGKLQIDASDRLKTMSKGTKEKVQLILVMSRHADLYILDEPIAGRRSGRTRFYLKYHPVELRTGGFHSDLDASDRRYREYSGRSHLHRSRSDPAYRIRG